MTADETDKHFEVVIDLGDVDAALALYDPATGLVATPGEPVFRADATRDVEMIRREDRR
jgi:hypothetical protein